MMGWPLYLWALAFAAGGEALGRTRRGARAARKGALASSRTAFWGGRFGPRRLRIGKWRWPGGVDA